MTLLEESIAALGTAVQHLRLAAASDDKTPLGNGLALSAHLRTLNEDGGQFVIIYGDINGLKAINTAHKHRGGDVAINRVGCMIAETVRPFPKTAAYRQSGDEFTLISPRSNLEPLVSALARMLGQVDVWYQGEHFRVSMSFGWADADPAAEAHEWQARAEVACMVAKTQARFA